MLSDKQIKVLAEDKRFDWSDTRCFTENFQKHEKPKTERLSVREMKEAYSNSQEVYDSEVVPYLPSRVSDLSKKIFVIDEWLIEDPKVVEEKGTSKLHLIGGRHRLFAISDVLGRIGSYLGIGEEIFNQLVRVEFISGVEKADIPRMVLANNESRVVKKAEKYNLLALSDIQQTDDPEDYLRQIFAAGYLPKVAIDVAATYFNMKKSKALGSKAYPLGVGITRYALYGIIWNEKPVTKKTPKVVSSVAELHKRMGKLWGCCEMVAIQNKELNTKEILSKAIEMCEREEVRQ